MIDILIPVLDRPHNAATISESVKVTQTPHRVIFICSPGDDRQIEACLQTGHDTRVVPWSPGRADFAKKVNWGYENTTSEWLFQAADDLRFYPDWDTQALRMARMREKLVIGTNDLHNSQVRRGVHATHVLFARRYIEEQGGTHDNTGWVYSETYDHQYVDLEFCLTAKRRGVWAFCKTSIVEHLHPHWKLAAMDDTYRKAMRNTGQDYRLYQERMGLQRISNSAERRRARRMAQ